jgi:hypothetical protein
LGRPVTAVALVAVAVSELTVAVAGRGAAMEVLRTRMRPRFLKLDRLNVRLKTRTVSFAAIATGIAATLFSRRVPPVPTT